MAELETTMEADVRSISEFATLASGIKVYKVGLSPRTIGYSVIGTRLAVMNSNVYPMVNTTMECEVIA